MPICCLRNSTKELYHQQGEPTVAHEQTSNDNIKNRVARGRRKQTDRSYNFI